MIDYKCILCCNILTRLNEKDRYSIGSPFITYMCDCCTYINSNGEKISKVFIDVDPTKNNIISGYDIIHLELGYQFIANVWENSLSEQLSIEKIDQFGSLKFKDRKESINLEIINYQELANYFSHSKLDALRFYQ